ncbi:EXLDI protein [Streptomyces albicerus]|uniref:EXLDI protein n=1 Tax=Streptomyces albicerus TaxID=2569859 RepID=UPI001788D53A|nr:EXLDI protein [Streptomyces albicerus]
MPNRTIYVAEGDVALFQRAQDLTGGNLSGVIGQALRRFVELKEAHLQGYEEVEVRVGRDGVYHRKRFVARLVAQRRKRASDGRSGEWFAVYQTRRGRFAVYSKRVDESDTPSAESTTELWTGEPGAGGAEGRESRNSIEFWENVSHLDSWSDWGVADSAELSLDVYENLDDLKGAVPPELARVAEANSQQQPVEELDI